MRKERWTRFWAVLATIAVCAILAEFGLRAAGRPPSNTTEGFFDQHGRSYRLKKNLTKIVKIPSYSYTLYTNAYGFRDERTGPRRIGPDPYCVFLGDSMTFANGVDYERSFVGVFARLAAARSVGTVNLAVGGHHLLEQQDVFRGLMGQVDSRPSRVIVCFSPISIDGFDKSYSNILVKNGYLFEQDGWRMAYLRVWLGDSSALYCFLRDNIRKIQAAHSDNRLLFAHEHLRFYGKDHRLTVPENQARFHALMKEFEDYLADMGAAPVYVYLPASPDLKIDDFLAQTGDDPADYDFRLLYRLLESHCRDRQIPLIDLTSLLKERYDAGEQMNFMLDAHYNAHANEIIGTALFSALYGSGAPQAPAPDPVP